VTVALKAVPQQEFQKKLSNSGSIIVLSAQLLKGSTLKVAPLSKLKVCRYACNKIILETSWLHLINVDIKLIELTVLMCIGYAKFHQTQTNNF
jgi:hypothetical protein